MTRRPVKRAAIAVRLLADVQDNGDGTWTAIAYLAVRSVGPVTGGSCKEALSLLEDAASVDISAFAGEHNDRY